MTITRLGDNRRRLVTGQMSHVGRSLVAVYEIERDPHSARDVFPIRIGPQSPVGDVAERARRGAAQFAECICQLAAHSTVAVEYSYEAKDFSCHDHPVFDKQTFDVNDCLSRYDVCVQQQRTNRDKLLDGALACVRERGYGNTSSRDIARAAGVNVASINYHFGSKDALLDDALGRCFSTWNQVVQEAFVQAAATTPYGQIRAVFEATIDSFEQIRPAVNACVESYAPALRSEALRERLAAGYADVRQRSVDLARAALAGTEVEPPETLPTIISVLMAVIDGLMIQWIADPSATPRSTDILGALADIGAVVTPP